jgi:adenylyltransferase/sulfurtransferase
MNRYQRQTLLPQVGSAGQTRLKQARALLIGCGALGTVVADYLVRAGVGHLTIVDRDVVELTNLQRQTLFDESDARDGVPKAVAGANRLKQVNADVIVEPVVADVHQENVESLVHGVNVVVDGTDNAETRYLVNDVSVKHGIPWVYGAAVGTEGRVLAIDSPRTPCLRCVFPEAPSPGELQTCDTAGVLGPAAGVVGALQAAAVIRLLVGEGSANELVIVDAWTSKLRSASTVDARRDGCPTCAQRRFDFLTAPSPATTALCGRDSVQIRPRVASKIDLAKMAAALAGSGQVEQSPFLIRYRSTAGERVTVFGDGRVIVHDTTDAARARSIAAKVVSA